jgi:WD40 repeat protein
MRPNLFLLFLSLCCLVIPPSFYAVPDTLSVSRRTLSVGTTLTTYDEHRNAVSAVAWSPDGKELASAGLDTTVQIWNASTGKALMIYLGHAASVTAIAWSPDSKHLASVGFDMSVQVWNAATGRPLWMYCCQGWVNGITWSSDGRYVASANTSRTVQVWQSMTEHDRYSHVDLPQSPQRSARGGLVP